jgi:hypothetical protein
VSVGHVGEQVKQDDNYVSASVLIQDASTIAAVAADPPERSDLSCGYSCDIERVSGEYEGERYDVRQRNIVYNHVALLPPGRGRAGREVALRLDSAGNQIVVADLPLKPEKESMPTYKIDGVDYDVGTPVFLQALQRRDSKNAKDLQTAVAERDTAVAERDVAQKEKKDLQQKLDAATDPAALDTRVAARLELFDKARVVLGSEIKFDGKSDREVMVQALLADDKEFDPTDRSDEYLKAFFDARTGQRQRQDSGIDGFRRTAEKRQRQDGTATGKSPRQRMLDRNQGAARQPLLRSTQ